MSTTEMIPSLALMTLVGVVLIAIIGLMLFLRKRGNRKPVERPDLAGHTMAPTEADQR